MMELLYTCGFRTFACVQMTLEYMDLVPGLSQSIRPGKVDDGMFYIKTHFCYARFVPGDWVVRDVQSGEIATVPSEIFGSMFTLVENQIAQIDQPPPTGDCA